MISNARMSSLSVWRRSFRYRLVACLAVALAFHAALAPAAAVASVNHIGDANPIRGTLPNAAGSQTTSSRPVYQPGPGSVAAQDAAPSEATIPELWTPRAAVVLETTPPVSAQTLFDGDAVTGLTAEAGKAAAVRIDLGAKRQVMAIGLHGDGRAKMTVYAEENGVRRLLGAQGGAAVDLTPDRWAQVVLPPASETSTLVVQWTASSSAAATLTELAPWVAGNARQALSEAAVADRLLTGLPENAVAATATPWNASVARVTAKGAVSATFTVKLDRDPMLGRAFLTYELEKKAHWTGAARSINGHVVRGGYRANAKGLGGVQVEEINPTWLKQGDNAVSFQPTLIEDGLGYEIRNVRIVSLPRGAESVAAKSSPGAGASSAIADGDLTTGVGGPGMHAATLPRLPDSGEPAFLSFYLDKPTLGTMTVTAGAERAARRGQLRVDLDGRSAGWQAVPIAGVLPSASELRLRMQGDRESAGQISEARVVSFPMLASSSTEMTVSYPLHGECQEHKTYVRGFASRTVAGKRPQFLVDGQPRPTQIDSDGSFEMDVPEPAAARGKPWSVRLDVVDDAGNHATRTVPVDICVDTPSARALGGPPIEDEGAPYGVVVSSHKASTLSFADAKIEIPAGAVDADTRVTMRALDRGQLHPTPAEMDNVIGSGGALRFGPHGLKFKRPVRITLPVDPARLPPGMTAADVQIFFFDEAAGKWTQLRQLRAAPDHVVAETTHFTDFAPMTVRTPEHPDLQQFNPNTFKDMKVGEPGAGITLIQPPEPNSHGSANLSYPIETPPGRNGIGPKLALTYDSERVNANGWLGVGWDLRMSSIEIDGRFGVPKYDGSETYALDGAMLTLGSAAGTYVRRVEGSFDLITRIGTGPTTYYWTVTDKSGTVYTYGTKANTRLANLRTGQPANIFRWYLEKVEDTYGNYMTITYQHDTFSQGTSPNVETFDEVYPHFIDYTAGPGVAAAYEVEFDLDTAGTRPDMTINARAGFLVETRQRLQYIKVSHGTTLVRQYDFEYRPTPTTDPMQKSLLSAVALWGPGGSSSELYRHKFEYNAAPTIDNVFSPQQPWGHFWQNASTGGLSPRVDNGLSHSADSLGGGSVTVGVGFPVVSATGSFGMDSGGSNTSLALFPVTGEGLPDQVDLTGLVSRNVPISRLPLPIDTGDLFTDASLVGLPSLGESSRSGWTAGGNLSVLQGLIAGLGGSYARHVSTDSPIITDINGDGFPDVVYGEDGNVGAYVNDGKNNLTSQPWSGYSLSNGNAPFSTAARVNQASTALAFFHTDPLIRWVAPFSGMVTINFTATNSVAGPGFVVYDARADLFVTGDSPRSITLAASDPNTYTLEATPNYRKMVNAGDRIYLRVATPGANAIGHAVYITGSIVYDTPAGANASDLEPYGPSRYSFSYSDDKNDKMTAGPRTAWHLEYDGDISVNRCFFASPIPDDVTVSLVIRDKTGNQVSRFDKTVLAKDVPQDGVNVCFDTTILPPYTANPDLSLISNVVADENISYEITSDTRIDPERIDFDTSMRYERLCRVGRSGSVCGVPQSNGGLITVPNDPWPNFPISETAGIVSTRVIPFVPGYVWQTYNGTSTAPQPTVSYPAPSTSLTFGGAFTLAAPLPGDALLLIQGVNKLHEKVRIPAGTSGAFSLPGSCAPPIGSGTFQCSGPTGAVAVQPNEPIFFTMYSPTASTRAAITNSLTWHPSVNGSTVASSLINTAILDQTYDNNHGSDRDPMSGGYHQWFYGDWNESIPWNESLISRTSVNPQNADAIVPAIPQFDSDDDFWDGRGGAQITDEYVVPGRVGNPLATAVDGSGAVGLRIADTWNIDVNMNGTGLNFGVNGGDSTTQVDFFDVNGDRFPDSVTNAGIQYSDRVSAFLPRVATDMAFSDSGELRRTLNASVQIGVSLGTRRQLVSEGNGDGETKKLTGTAAVGGSLDYGVSSTRIDFVDVNGDGLVDHVAEDPSAGNQLRVRLNLGYGFSNEIPWAFPAAWTTGFTSGAVSLAGITLGDLESAMTLVHGSPDSTNAVRVQDTGTSTLSIGGSVGILSGGGGPTFSVTRKWVDLFDVNGDGLADQVLKVPGDPSLHVRLNTGTGFAAEQVWGLPNWTTSTGTDYSFLPPDGLGFSTIDGWSKSVSFQVCFIGCLGMSGFDTDSHGGPSADFEDIDGDGKLDQVMKIPGDSNIYAKINNIGQANLLSAVDRPLGGRFTINYTRAGNHVDLTGTPLVNMPSNQWVMSGVVLDGQGGIDPNASCPDQRITENFSYSNSSGQPAGYFDPVERESFGYSDVKTTYPCEGTSIAQTYNNQNYYLRGLQASETWYPNDSVVPLRSSSKAYSDPSGKDSSSQPPHVGTYFPSPDATITHIQEGGSAAVVQMYYQTFDTNGNLTDVSNNDQYDSTGDLTEHIVYQHPSANITVPLSITTRAADGTLLRKRMATFFPEGKPQTITDVIAGGKNPDATGTPRTESQPANATWAFTYDAFGNVRTATSPGRRTLQYGYDPTAQTYPITTTQVDPNPSFQYTASANYDLRFGLPIAIVDEGGARQEIDYDNYGRITAVFAPSDFNGTTRINPNAPTIDITYSETAHTNGASAETLPAYAVATHRTNAPPEGSVPPNPEVAPTQISAIQTANFVDGLTRTIETKKDITRDNGQGNLAIVMSVSGKVTFDARGRVYTQDQPTFSTSLNAAHFEAQTTPLNPTQYQYDVLGRLRQEQHSDGGNTAVTAISYKVDVAQPIGDAVPYVIKTTTDPLYPNDNSYHFRTEYVTALGHVRGVFYRNQISERSSNVPVDLRHLYQDDPLGQVVAVTDPNGNVTTAAYDTVGNLVKVVSPDSGQREWRYCVGGYVCAEESPNSRAANKLIQYTYDRDRLTTITYPSDHNVTFTYGGPLEGYKAGRVKHRVDEGGAYDYAYDALGNVTNETVVLNSQMGGPAQTYTTKYLWDNFGRLIDVTIPGLSPTAATETIRYGYDAGGSVASAIGLMGSVTNNYVNHVGYDEFGAEVRTVYGNGVSSTYGYAFDTRRLIGVNTTIHVGANPFQPTQSLLYSYDLVGNVRTRTQALDNDNIFTDVVPVGGSSNMTFTYDPLNQLTHADLLSQNIDTQQHRGSYDVSFDPIGNVTSKSITNAADTLDGNGNVTSTNSSGSYSFAATYGGATFNPGPHAATFINGGNSAIRAYDRDGNLASTQWEGSGTTFNWTDTDRLRSICSGLTQNCAFPTAQALYDANGVRTSNKVNGATETLYVNQYLTIRQGTNGPLPTKHVYVGDARVASKIDNTDGTSATYWYHSDNLQSAEYVTTATQAVVQHLEYFPSGEIWYETTDSSRPNLGAVAHETTFTGKELDPSGFYYFGARYYDPQVQSWLSPDPILDRYMRGGPNGGVFQPKNLGSYTYAGNNPVVMKDPDGQFFWLIAGAAAALAVLSSEGNVEPPNKGGELGIRPTPLSETGIRAASFAMLFLSFRGGGKPGPWRGEPPPSAPPEPPPAQAEPPAPAEPPVPEQSGPTQAYNRRAHYGNTPTKADRKALGAGPDEVLDHDPSLVKRYYEGDPAVGEKPGKQMTRDERRASANDRKRMKLQPRTESNRQGYYMKVYSQSKRGDH